MDDIYELTYDYTLLAQEIFDVLKGNHTSALHLDKTCFVGKGDCCRIDTYQVFDLNWGGYITINAFFFRPDLTKDAIQVKISLFSPVSSDSSGKIKKLRGEIDQVIRSHIPA